MNWFVLFILLIIVFLFLKINDFLPMEYFNNEQLEKFTVDNSNQLNLQIQFDEDNVVFYWYAKELYDHFELKQSRNGVNHTVIGNKKKGFFEKRIKLTNKVKKGDTFVVTGIIDGVTTPNPETNSNHIGSVEITDDIILKISDKVEFTEYPVCLSDGSHEFVLGELNLSEQKKQKLLVSGLYEEKLYQNLVTENQLKELKEPNKNRYKINFS
jgi:hypothetical protein